MNKFLRRSTLALAVLTSLATLAAAWDIASYDAAAWQADLDRVEADMAQGYANLDWIADKRGLDLQRLDRERARGWRRALERARLLRLRDFVHAFRDPHLRLNGAAADRGSAARAAPDHHSRASRGRAGRAAGGRRLRAAGYEEGEHAFAFPFSQARRLARARRHDFPIGIAGDTGVLRIAQLGENQYLAACTAVFAPGSARARCKLKVRERQQAVARASRAAQGRRPAPADRRHRQRRRQRVGLGGDCADERQKR
jgi:hypothetical protein